MACARGRVPDTAHRSGTRTALLHARPGRPPHRSRPTDRQIAGRAWDPSFLRAGALRIGPVAWATRSRRLVPAMRYLVKAGPGPTPDWIGASRMLRCVMA